MTAMWCGVLAASLPLPAQAADAPLERVRGVRVALERHRGAGGAAEADVRLWPAFAVAVERDETPSPFLSPGLFRATLTAEVELALRDRRRFRLEGRGRAELSVNGHKVLDGALRPGRPLETAAAVRLDKGPNRLQLVFDSAAVGDGEVRLSWAGDEFGFEPIAPESLTVPVDAALQAGESRRHGHALFAARQCARCHDPEPQRLGESAFAELDAAGPDLRAIGARVRQDWLAAWLRDPRRFRADASMPRFRFERDGDADDVAAWLAGSGSPPTAPEFTDDQAAAGGSRFRELGCVACHEEPDRQSMPGALAARLPLGFVAAKWQPAALVAYLQAPQRDHPHARMPDFRLSREDALALAAHLLRAASSAEPLPVSRGDARRGRSLVQRSGCIDCHAVDTPLGAPRAPQLANLDPARGCLAEGGHARAPDHGLEPVERAALRAFLPFAGAAPWRRSPSDFAARQLEAQRCTACHALDGTPSLWARWATATAAAEPLPPQQDPVAQGIPSLTWVGAKLQPSWLEGFVRGRLPSPRPWLTARMPAFDLHGAGIASGLVRRHGHGAGDEPPVPADAQLALHGERLLAMGRGFGCVQCHAVGEQPAVQVFERAGIELLTARQRLRHEYYTRWLRDPTRLDAESRMPRYADAKGRTSLTEVLRGDAAAQFEAIWQHLGSRTTQGR
ncbi:MAG: c-type cytochrome [Planctomycetes bacterium]|nr:c-type cytochrome [Planctomycetota bacterium]